MLRMQNGYNFLSASPELALWMAHLEPIQFTNNSGTQNNDDLLRLRETEPVNLLKSAVMQQHVRINKQVGHSTGSRFPDSAWLFNHSNVRFILEIPTGFKSISPGKPSPQIHQL